MISIYCPSILHRFNEDEMHNLLDKIIKSVSDCLNYKFIQRKNKAGKRKASWKNHGNPSKLTFKGDPDYNFYLKMIIV